MTSSTRIDEYVIEVDDGINGEFQEVHRTPDPFCTLAGLQFNSVYRARVRAVNAAGESAPSDVIFMSTPEGKFFAYFFSKTKKVNTIVKGSKVSKNKLILKLVLKPMKPTEL